MLGEQYGRALENQELSLEYDRGAFFVRYYETRLPIEPCSYTQILEPLLERLQGGNTASQHKLIELESIITALRYLPSRSETVEMPAQWYDQSRERGQSPFQLGQSEQGLRIRRFIRAILCRKNRFINDFSEFHQAIARPGIFNSLSQVLLKIAAPGVPDFYQGTEIWDFSLVDPDNRRPVDFMLRRNMLAEIGKSGQSGAELIGLIKDLLRQPEDGRIKMFLMKRALSYRRTQHELFATGDYQPLLAAGSRKDHVIAFSRTWRSKTKAENNIRSPPLFSFPRRLGFLLPSGTVLVYN